MKINPKNLNQQDSHYLLTEIVAPRPIAWVSTVDKHGIFNLAPFSAYSMVSSRPMVVCFSVGIKMDGQKKDTLRNIELTGEFVINIVTKDLAEQMNITSAPYPSDINEFEKAKLTAITADIVKAPMVAESPVNMECRVIQTVDIGKPSPSCSLIIGEVLCIHIRDEFYDNQTRLVSGLRAIARLGGERDLYCLGQDTFEMARPAL
jgi:flavin reductase (DIM6/NTAB) family NADH-FMN oxidoreductase RutF